MKDKLKFSLGDMIANVFTLGIELGRSGNEHSESGSCPFPATQHDLEELEKHIHMKISELTGDLKSLQAQVTKAAAEQQKRSDDLSAKVAELEEIIKNQADGDVPQETADALAAVKTAVQALDDTIPDPLLENPPANS